MYLQFADHPREKKNLKVKWRRLPYNPQEESHQFWGEIEEEEGIFYPVVPERRAKGDFLRCPQDQHHLGRGYSF